MCGELSLNRGLSEGKYNDAMQHVLAASLKHLVFYPGWGLPRGFFCSVTPP